MTRSEISTVAAGQVELLTIAETARRLSISKRTLEREIARGRFPCPYRVGARSNRVPVGAIAAYLKFLRDEATPEFYRRRAETKNPKPAESAGVSQAAGLMGLDPAAVAKWEAEFRQGMPDFSGGAAP